MEPEKKQDRSWDASSPSVAKTDKDLNIKDLFIVTDNEVNLSSIGVSFSRVAVSGAVYSAAAKEYILGVTSLGVAPTIGLPRPKVAGFGKTYIVKDEAGGAASTTITIVSQGGENLDGSTSSTITSNYGAKSFYTDGASWFTF